MKGNVVDLDVTATGIEIRKADGDSSGKSGHYHVFIDRAPVAPGAVIPREAGVVHSTDDPIRLTGLGVGTHRLALVLGDGTHARIGSAIAETTIEVQGPSVDASAPAEVPSGQDLVVEIAVEGVQIVAAASDQGAPGTTGHLHVLIDPASPPAADGKPLPKDDRNIHTTETTVRLSGLAPGEHTIWVVLGDRAHIPYGPLVADRVLVTVK